MKIAFFSAKKYDIDSFNKNLIPNIEIKYLEAKLDEDTAKLAEGCEGICIFVNDICNKQVIDTLYKLGVKAIFLRCAGFNNVDAKACFGKIHVYRVPAYSPYAVAEFAFSLIMTLNRRIHKAYNRIREYNFSLINFEGVDLYNKTIGIIGTGKIGRIMIDIAKGFKMNILAFDKYPSEIEGVKYVDLKTLVKESDFISLHCPLTDDNFHMIDKSMFSLMKKDVMIINTSRGALIDSTALLEAIKERRIGSAALDVYEEESDIFYEDKSNHILNDDILRSLIAMPNVIVTSHQAFLTKEALDNIADTTLSNINNFYNDKPNRENEVCYKCMNKQNCQKAIKDKCF